MAAYFLDSSALVKRYLDEAGSAWVIALTNPVSGHRIYVSRITGVEVVAALVRQARAGNLARDMLAAALLEFRQNFARVYRTVPTTRALIERAMGMAHGHGLRAYDAVQLASVLHANAQRGARGVTSLVLVCSDSELSRAGEAEGLVVEDPNEHP